MFSAMLDLVNNPTTLAQLATFAFVLAVPASAMRLEGWKLKAPNAWAMVYAGLYVLSWLLANSFWAIYWGLVTPEGLEVSRQGASYVLARKVYTLHLHILVALYLWLHFYSTTSARMPKHDLQAVVSLGILATVESFAAFEYWECKILEPYAVAVAKTLGTIQPEYACQRAISVAAPYAAPIVAAGIWIGANSLAWNRKRKS